MKTITSFLKFCLPFLILIISLPAQSQQHLWTYDCGESSGMPVLGTDFQNNVYFLEPFHSSTPMTIANYNVGTNADLIKFNGQGVVQWDVDIGFSGMEFNRRMTISNSASNNPLIYICGATIQQPMSVYPALSKYDAFGNRIWLRQSNGPTNINNALLSTCTVDHAGNIYATGYLKDAMIWFGQMVVYHTSNMSYDDYFLIKYDSSGNELWAVNTGLEHCDIQWSGVCTGSDNSVYMIVNSYDYDFIFASDTLYKANASNINLFLLKYDSNGNPVWARSIGGASGNAHANDIAIDANDNIIVTGLFTPPIGIPGFATEGVLVAKYDSNGNRLWASHGDPVNGEVFSNSLTVDPVGNIYIGGDFTATQINFGNVSCTNYDTILTSRGGNVDDSWYAKLDPAGNWIYAEAFGAIPAGGQKMTSLTSDQHGDVIVSGYYNSPFMIIGNDTLTNTISQSKIYLSKINWSNVGVEENSSNESLSLYPNPAGDRIYISYSGKDLKSNEIFIYDSFGKLMLRKKGINQSGDWIDIGELAPGIYFICTNTGEVRMVGKLYKI